MGLMNIKNIDQIESLSTEVIFQYLSFSVILGIVLMIIAVWSCKKIGERVGAGYGTINKKKNNENAQTNWAELVLGSANVLFLCFGMTGIMILVNNNLARAFAIGAAIAVIRFRIKFDKDGLGSTLFFGVLVGMACGVGQIPTAIGLTLTYGVLQTIIISLISMSPKKAVKPVEATAEVTSAGITP